MFDIIEEGSDFVKIEPSKGVHISSFQWEAAKLSLLKNKKVIFMSNDKLNEISVDEAKKVIYPRRVRSKIVDLEDHESFLISELIETRKKKAEMKEFLKKISEIHGESKEYHFTKEDLEACIKGRTLKRIFRTDDGREITIKINSSK